MQHKTLLNTLESINIDVFKHKDTFSIYRIFDIVLSLSINTLFLYMSV